MARGPKFLDVSVSLAPGIPAYPGNPEFELLPIKRIAAGGSSNVSKLVMGTHTGTHVDAPKHFFDDGAGVDALPLDVLVGRARLIAFADTVMSVGKAELETHDLRGVTRLLIRTRNSAWLTSGDDTFHPDYTYLAPDGAAYLVELGVKLVGVDYLSVEQFHSGHHKTHRTLLERGVVIVEGLMLGEVPAGEYEFRCLPLRLTGLDGAPARAVLVTND